MKPHHLTAALRAALGTDQARRAVDDWAARRPVAEDVSPLAPEIRDGRLRLHLHCPIGPFYGCADGSDFSAAWRGRHDMPTDIFVDSPGGDVLTTRGINRQIRERDAETVFHVDGLAASAATVLACACDRRVAAPGSRILVHEAWVFAVGNKRHLRAEADDLEKTDAEIAEDYAAIGNLSASAFTALMEEEQLLTPKEALAHGLIDAISGAKQNNNTILRAFTEHLTLLSRGN